MGFTLSCCVYSDAVTVSAVQLPALYAVSISLVNICDAGVKVAAAQSEAHLTIKSFPSSELIFLLIAEI